jgi:hypothetical protein
MSVRTHPPFIVFSLPRSRSAWLSVLLSGGGEMVGHDTGIDCRTPEDFVFRLAGMAGTCETGAMFAWPLLRRMLPEVTFAVVRRDPRAVCASLERFGLNGYLEEMQARAALLDEIAALPGVLSVDADSLANPGVCSALFAHCTGRAMSARWWGHMAALNVQVDMPSRIDRLVRNADRIAALKAEVARRLAHG